MSKTNISMVSTKSKKSKRADLNDLKANTPSAAFSIKKSRIIPNSFMNAHPACAEGNKVNRMMNVLHKNINSSSQKRVGCLQKTIIEQDPKRQKIMRQLQKHFQMKEEDANNKSTTLSFAEDTLIFNNKEGDSDADYIFDGFAGFTTPPSQTSYDQTIQSIKKKDTRTIVTNFDVGDEMPMQFQEVSRIANSFHLSNSGILDHISHSSASPKTTSIDKEDLINRKLRVMCSLMQLYCMLKTDNPFNFSYILMVWKTLKRLQNK